MTCSDVICDFPLKDMLAFHQQKGAEGTILVTRVSLLSHMHNCLAYFKKQQQDCTAYFDSGLMHNSIGLVMPETSVENIMELSMLDRI